MAKIKTFRTLLVAAALACSSLPLNALPAQTLGSSYHVQAGTGILGSHLQIIAPRPNQKIDVHFVKVDFEYGPKSISAEAPTFRIRLDDQEPVQANNPAYTFTEVSPGTHVVRVELLDANGLPVPGTQAQVQFQALVDERARPVSASSQQGTEGQADPQSRLPLLSVIGFGILLAGLLSAMKARPGQ